MYLGLQNRRNIPNQCVKFDKGREDTLLAKMYGSNPSIQGQIRRFKRLDGVGRGRNREGDEEMRPASARETWFWILNKCSAPEYMVPSSAPRCRPRKRQLGWLAVLGQAPRRHDSWRRPPGSKMSLSLSGGQI